VLITKPLVQSGWNFGIYSLFLSIIIKIKYMQNSEKHSEIINSVKQWLTEHPELKTPEDFIFQVVGGINPVQAEELFKSRTVEENIISLIEFFTGESGYPTVATFLEGLEIELEDWISGGLEEDPTLRGF